MMYQLHCPPTHPLGAWSPKNYEASDRDLTQWLPVPRTQFWGVLALFAATITAVRGRTDTKSLLVAASVGALTGIALTLASGKD